MKKYDLIKINNDDKYIIIDILDINTKKYIFAFRILNDIDVSNEFDIYIHNDYNIFEKIENEEEYNYIKKIFLNRLENSHKEDSNKEKNKESKILKLKVISINNYDYIFEKENSDKIGMNIEIYGDVRLEINDYIYIKESTTKENITVRFGSIYNNKTEVIKIIRNNDVYYLQRYYG